MEAYYIVIKIGGSFVAILIKDNFDLQAESENIMDHVKNGNTVTICDELETITELYQIDIADIIIS